MTNKRIHASIFMLCNVGKNEVLLSLHGRAPGRCHLEPCCGAYYVAAAECLADSMEMASKLLLHVYMNIICPALGRDVSLPSTLVQVDVGSVASPTKTMTSFLKHDLAALTMP